MSHKITRIHCVIPGCGWLWCRFWWMRVIHLPTHYNDVIMSPMASQITRLTIVYSTVYSDADQRKHQSSAAPAFVRGIHRWPVNSPHKRPVTRTMFPFRWRHHDSGLLHQRCGNIVFRRSISILVRYLNWHHNIRHQSAKHGHISWDVPFRQTCEIIVADPPRYWFKIVCKYTLFIRHSWGQ